MASAVGLLGRNSAIVVEHRKLPFSTTPLSFDGTSPGNYC